jgi:glycosyltransferase involved in cell wall biosynthesis
VSPAISVLIAVRNPGRFLEPTLRSLAGQTFQDFEAIVVDNGSRDGTDRILAAWAAKDQRIRLFRSQSLGLARCLNFAATHARAPLLARLDGDDILFPDRFSVQYARMSREPGIGLLGACVELIDGEDKVIGRRRLPLVHSELKAFLKTGNPFVHSTTIMRRSIFESLGGYRTTLRLCEDFDLWSRMAEVTEIANCDEILAQYRMHEGSISAARPIRMAITDACIIAASRARQNNRPEPFLAGTPHLRAALSILEVSRDEFRYRALKSTTGVARLALSRNDVVLAKRLRLRAWSLVRGMPVRTRLRGYMRILGSYFKRGSRHRRKEALRKLFGLQTSPARDPD